MRSLRDALDMAGMTDPGRVRGHNEDAVLFDADLGIVALADGMGGYNAGEVASGLTVDAVNEILRAELAAMSPHLGSGKSLKPQAHDMLMLAIERANSVVYQTACSEPLCAGMGTTLVAALFYDNRLVVGHVGDSRLYRYRNTDFSRLTRDHSLLQMQLDAGLITPEEARHATHKNLVTRAVGIEPEVEPEIQEFLAVPGDVYLFCSDGLTEMVDDQLIGEMVGQFTDNLPMAAQALVEQANANGGRDNISVALVAVKRDYSAETGWISRLASRFR
ncbi:protein phosphatase [Formivibrio citricus]|uniref:Protein phosphatase n=1 Tax=Formivibrio citricus TaxID=83765 RepID=A0A1I4XTL5_9NEIS|nr:Stp1/IreP family PP2C-type Ser/Thr phosphatase [Formivibrio citricus]SFN28996.1 protein phosphatase [Formivibrio citricus]